LEQCLTALFENPQGEVLPMVAWGGGGVDMVRETVYILVRLKVVLLNNSNLIENRLKYMALFKRAASQYIINKINFDFGERTFNDSSFLEQRHSEMTSK